MKLRYPISQPKLSQSELRLITRAVKSTWISSTGEYIEKFETKFARTFGVRYAITTSNGTASLHLSLLALGIGPGDEVIVPALTFVASANSVAYSGAVPVFVDVDPLAWTIDTTKIKEKVNRKTRAIMPVHLYGYPAAMDQIKKLATEFHLYIIEDAAEAHGAKYKGKYVGTIGDIGCFSFYGNKIITTGEGGMILTNSKTLRDKILLLKNHGMSPKKRYWHPVLGYNYRMTNLQAAIGVAQMKRYQTFIEKRRQVEKWYNTYLSKINEIILPPQNNTIHQGVNWLYTILVNPRKQKSRDGLIDFLKKHSIDSRPVFYPIPKFPMYKTHERFPVSENLAQIGITLPTYVDLTHTDVVYICNTLALYMKS